MGNDEDTIFAVAAGGAGAALTVIRVSGPRAGPILDHVCGRRPAPRLASLRAFRSMDGEVLDRGIALWFPGPASYTGEDSAELHPHGGRAVLTAIATALTSAGGRPAEPGEFTRRAFLNGRMDLTEAEGVADLVAAETEAQRRQAVRQMDGALGALYRRWATELTRLAAWYEAAIDFPDEQDVPAADDAALRTIARLHREIATHLDDGRRGERIREGLVFAIVGAPNVGKSSLINALTEREVAIVSGRPGTTRDVLEARLDFNGVMVTLLDTAGLRETEDAVEAEGVRRARARAESADLVIEVRDAQTPGASDGDRPGWAMRSGSEHVLVINKCDLAPAGAHAGVVVSALTDNGIGRLRDLLCARARALTTGGGDAPLTRARHRAALAESMRRLSDAADAPLPELRGEDVRLALRALGRVTGRVGVEHVLDAVFAQFCIGK